jgi:hypothetical protein
VQDISKPSVESHTKKYKRVRTLTVLFVEWSSRGRDFEIDLPLMYFFEKVLHSKVEYKCIFDVWGIIRSKPDIIIMSNTTGGKVNVELSKMINKSGFLFFSHVSEGLFIDDKINAFMWGWNHDFKIYEKLKILWSHRSCNIAANAFPETRLQLKVSGATGFDKYKIYKSKTDFNTKGYKQIVLYAGHSFVYLESDFNNVKTNLIKQFGADKVENFFEYKDKIKMIFHEIVPQNPDTLFIFKNHPGEFSRNCPEGEGLESYENVCYIKNEYSFSELLQHSDILLTFKSTTNLEGYLLDKPVIILCEDEELLSDLPTAQNGFLCEDSKKINQYIKEHFSTGKIKDYDEKKMSREKIIKDCIGFSDGLNHVRFMSFLKPFIESDIPKGQWQFSFKDKVKALISQCYFKARYFLPERSYISNWAKRFDSAEVSSQKKMRYPDFDEFYKENDEKIKYIYDNYASSWKVSHKINETSHSKSKE